MVEHRIPNPGVGGSIPSSFAIRIYTMTTVIRHDERFMTGTRVIQLCSRNKDGSNAKKMIHEVTHNRDQFSRVFDRMVEMAEPGDRIYASAESRDMSKAVRSFKQAQLDADYDQDPTQFYRNIRGRWVSALMQKSNSMKEDRWWLVDCDTSYDKIVAEENIKRIVGPKHLYDTKNGRHYLIEPCDLREFPDAFNRLVHKNPMMLWAY